MTARLPCLHPLHLLLPHTFHLLLSTILTSYTLSNSLSSPPHHPLVFTPWRIFKPVTHCPSPHRLCQQLFNDGSRSQAKLGQLTGCLCTHAVRLESVTYKAAYTFKF